MASAEKGGGDALGKMETVEIQSSPGEKAGVQIKLSPVGFKILKGGDGGAAPGKMATALPGGVTRVQIKAASGVEQKGVLIPAASSEASPGLDAQQRTSSPKRRHSELECFDPFKGDIKRTRSYEVADVMEESPFNPKEHDDLGSDGFGLLKGLKRDVTDLKMNLAVGIGNDDIVRQLVIQNTRSRDVIIAEAPKEAMALASAVRKFTKYKRITEELLRRREATAMNCELRQDHRDVRQDHRDVRQDHRDVRQEHTIAQYKRELDSWYDKYSDLKSMYESRYPGKQSVETRSEEQQQETHHEELLNKEGKECDEKWSNDDTKCYEEQPKEKQPKGYPGKQSVETRSEEQQQETHHEELLNKEGKECDEKWSNDATKCDEEQPKEKQPKEMLSAVTQGLDKAESVVNLGERTVNLVERAAEVGSRAARVGTRSKKLQAFLGMIATSASTLARQALRDMQDMGIGESSDGDESSGGDDDVSGLCTVS